MQLYLIIQLNNSKCVFTDNLSVTSWNCLRHLLLIAFIFLKKARFILFWSVFWPAVSFLAGINYPGILEPVLRCIFMIEEIQLFAKLL